MLKRYLSRNLLACINLDPKTRQLYHHIPPSQQDQLPARMGQRPIRILTLEDHRPEPQQHRINHRDPE